MAAFTDNPSHFTQALAPIRKNNGEGNIKGAVRKTEASPSSLALCSQDRIDNRSVTRSIIPGAMSVARTLALSSATWTQLRARKYQSIAQQILEKYW